MYVSAMSFGGRLSSPVFFCVSLLINVITGVHMAKL